MTTFVRLSIFGLVAGGIYFVVASGLVLTYATTGVFNFAHGAFGMLAAFCYWELRFNLGWPAPLVLVLVIGVGAPLAGMMVEKVLVRRLHGAPLATTLVITVGLLAGLIGMAQHVWKPEARPFPGFFDPEGFHVLGVFVTWHRAITVLVAIAVAVGLRIVLYDTRWGISMRAVVDDRDLAALNGARPARTSSLAWALGAALAALAGVLLAPVLIRLDIVPLTLLVLDAYAAAVVGRLRSLPLTLVGALILGFLQSYSIGYLPRLFPDNALPSWLSGIGAALPVLMLFVVLLLMPEARLRGTRTLQAASVRVAGLRQSLLGAAALVVAAGVVVSLLAERDVLRVGQGLAIALVVLSMVPLTGYAGQVSLCQLTFAGIGAYCAYRFGEDGSLMGPAVAVVVTGAVGALVALPAVRLQGLYLALSTLAFAVFMDVMVFQHPRVFSVGSVILDRVEILGVSFEGERAYFMLLAAVYGACAVGVLALRRGRLGRRLVSLRDSPAACATLGLSVTRTKLVVFTLSAAMAGFGGAMFAGLRVAVGANDFTMVDGLQILLLAVIGGIATGSGPLFAGTMFAIMAIVSQEISWLSWLHAVGPALVGIGMARHPEGVVVKIGELWRRVRARRVEPGKVPRVEVTLTSRLPFGARLAPEQARTLDTALGIGATCPTAGDGARVPTPVLAGSGADGLT